MSCLSITKLGEFWDLLQNNVSRNKRYRSGVVKGAVQTEVNYKPC